MEPKLFFIAGVQFRTQAEQKTLASLTEGEVLTLVPEPDNQYDSNAVKIMKGDAHLGYVPRRFSSEVSAALEVGATLTCAVITINPGAKSYERCEVEILEEAEIIEGLDDEEDVEGIN